MGKSTGQAISMSIAAMDLAHHQYFIFNSLVNLPLTPSSTLSSIQSRFHASNASMETPKPSSKLPQLTEQVFDGLVAYMERQKRAVMFAALKASSPGGRKIAETLEDEMYDKMVAMIEVYGEGPLLKKFKSTHENLDSKAPDVQAQAQTNVATDILNKLPVPTDTTAQKDDPKPQLKGRKSVAFDTKRENESKKRWKHKRVSASRPLL
ncbi:hypothetical protein M501DRAFT_1030175 [Patellaria atrata CBS 101060]|uniref:Uncharacterized protein n=1 Tax=Patellaria atrata CBS 101060 TaxID=1346257 RepID=A0A9P4SE35_9PEZI|nr:hypothetical protein M501DRAFT_1030175 [Patellaria atrata CBS 101060]